MRKVTCLMAAVLVTGVATSFAVTSATATGSPQWFRPYAQLTIPSPHMLQVDVGLTNVGTVRHTGTVTVTIAGPKIYRPHLFSGRVSLVPGGTWRWGLPTGYAPTGTYVVTITATHVTEGTEPPPLPPTVTATATTKVG